MKDNERNQKKKISASGELLTFNSPLPLTQSSHLHMNSNSLSVPKSHCTEHPNFNQMMFSSLCLLQYNRTSLWYRYISFLDLTYNHNWSHVVIEEHSDVPVYQTSRAISPILYIQSIIGVLYSTVTYVWAQDITWDWMWCSSYCRKKKALLLLFTLSYLFHMIF